ncbi:SGNH/GDSL hydrolase family protein [Staphylococcus hominis]|uniref:SGNH/GDSL hydrolase family protein n=1 Tax=Staphylococcus hominis TaxID=1290 RepID=UPI0031BA84F4
MGLITTNLSNQAGAEFRRQLIENFKEIEDFMGDYKTGEAEKKISSLVKKYEDELFKEVRAIVMPEESPLEVTKEVVDSKTDLKGVKHGSLSERIRIDLEQLKKDQVENNPLHNTVVTKNGTIVYDYSKKSQALSDIKNIYCIGDSVARGLHASKNFGQFLAEKLNANLNNLAVSGATFSKASDNSIFDQALKVKDADLVIVQGTDDDWLKNDGIELGVDKTDIRTFLGAFYQIIKVIRAQNKDAKIVCMTATRQLPVNGTYIRRKDTDRNRLNLSLEDYVNAQVLACTELDVPIFDAYHTDIINPYNPGFRKKYMTDGLHPNELIHEVISYELLKNYYYFYG